MTCVISALAFSADAAQYTSVDMIQPYAATVTGSASSDDESEILSSQDWEALLNVSSVSLFLQKLQIHCWARR